ncbi:MAG: CTP--2,3-di-O-geranylgeranyl-sn-glycero-1-phosphate cytidyltransferase [Candidatus Aenigmarchaeota archaeon]|nr:CTP--2,3-di-O-geranylgeranyl-sn-glycero-1-phosphate cytidyltransferase [Candidatus Aenigmarchaeota archaeon]
MKDNGGMISIRKEIFRKMVHLTSVLIVASYYYFGKQVTLYLLAVTLILFIESEYVRIEWKRTLPLVHDGIRKKERHTMAGHVFFLIGAIISISIFDMNIAIAAILMTTFGDSAAAIIGRKFGRTWIPRIRSKSLEGCFAELVVNLIIGYIFLDNLIVLLVMAFTATIVETLIEKLDDNLLIPVFSGFNGQIVVFLLRIFGH